MRMRQQQVIGRGVGGGRQAEYIVCLGAPVALEHFRQSPDDDVDKAADDQAENECAKNKGQRVAGQEIG